MTESAKESGRYLTVLNTADDYQRLIEILRSFGLPVTIGFEARATITGP